MRERAHHRRERKPIFVGCEGQSEVGYVAFISSLIEDAGLSFFIKPVLLRPAGDPLARVERAIRLINENRRKRVDYAERFILMDSDQISLAPERAKKAATLAREHRISIIWQHPCHEALLLRHFSAQETKRPTTNALSDKSLVKLWPDYVKPMSRISIACTLDFDAVCRAAKVELELKALLVAVRLIAA